MGTSRSFSAKSVQACGSVHVDQGMSQHTTYSLGLYEGEIHKHTCMSTQNLGIFFFLMEPGFR